MQNMLHTLNAKKKTHYKEKIDKEWEETREKRER